MLQPSVSSKKWVLLLVIIGLSISSVSAETYIIDDYIDLYEYTGGKYTIAPTGDISSATFMGNIKVYNIEKMEELNYISIDIPASRLSSYVMGEGRNNISYELNGASKSCSIDVTYDRNLLGQLTGAHFLIWLYDWDVGTMTGTQTIKFSTTLWKEAPHSGNSVVTSSNMVVTNNEGTIYSKDCIISYTSGTRIKQHIKVTDAYENTSYSIEVQKEFDSNFYYSIVKAYSANGEETYKQESNKNFKTFLPKTTCSNIVLSLYGREYTYQLDSGGEAPSSENFILSVTPMKVSTGEAITAQLNPLEGGLNYDYISWSCTIDGENERVFSLENGTWMQYNRETEEYDIPSSLESALSQTYIPNMKALESISCRVYSVAEQKKLADLAVYDIEVSENTGMYSSVHVTVLDGNTNYLLAGVNLKIENQQTGEILKNEIISSQTRVLLPIKYRYKFTFSKSGYEQKILTGVDETSTEIRIPMMKVANPTDETYTIVYFHVKDSKMNPIANAEVNLADSALSFIKYAKTNSEGIATIEVKKNTTYDFTVAKTDYMGITDTIIVEENAQWKYVYLQTLAEITDIPTIQPSITPTGVTTPSTNETSPLYNFYRIFMIYGFNFEQAGIMIGLVITGLLFAIGAKYGESAIAGLAGAVIGIIFSSILGLIPMWVIMSIILVAAAIVAAKMYGGQ